METARPARAAERSPLPEASLRAALKAGRDALREAFLARPDTPKLLREHARLVDRTVREAWRACAMPARTALVAVGGYGRGQLFPHSDVDLLILLPSGSDGADASATQAIERLLTTLWDVGLEASHAVRTVAECVTEMAADAGLTSSSWARGPHHQWGPGQDGMQRMQFSSEFDDADTPA